MQVAWLVRILLRMCKTSQNMYQQQFVVFEKLYSRDICIEHPCAKVQNSIREHGTPGLVDFAACVDVFCRYAGRWLVLLQRWMLCKTTFPKDSSTTSTRCGTCCLFSAPPSSLPTCQTLLVWLGIGVLWSGVPVHGLLLFLWLLLRQRVRMRATWESAYSC